MAIEQYFKPAGGRFAPNTKLKRKAADDEQQPRLKRAKPDVKPTMATKQAKPQGPTKEKSNLRSKPTRPSSATPKEALKVTEEIGDIFDAPPNTLIIHACNCQGSWAAGIAKAFKDNYPSAFPVYSKYCREWKPDQLVSTAQLIPPTIKTASKPRSKARSKAERKHFVGCLFTSRFYGRRKDSPDEILEATKPAMEDLLRKVQDWNAEHDEADRVREVRICKINSGLFAVPWEETRAVLEGIDVSGFDVKEIKVVSRDE